MTILIHASGLMACDWKRLIVIATACKVARKAVTMARSTTEHMHEAWSSPAMESETQVDLPRDRST